jgi:hydroxymethylglutaryl-CoA reductase
MILSKAILGFSKLDKHQKLDWLHKTYLNDNASSDVSLTKFWIDDQPLQRIIDGFSENTVSNFIMPYGLAPNFLIDGKVYCVPMVIEESSVVAAASSAAKYWMDRGGFSTQILGTTKVGQVHFTWKGPFQLLTSLFPQLESQLRNNASAITANMEKRGGGISSVELVDFSDFESNLAQLRVKFETCDSMGANFINSVLENFAATLENFFVEEPAIPDDFRDVNIIMSILSNYTPECLVRAEVQSPVSALGNFANGMMADELAEKFRTAVKIAHIDTYRAVTHNKGIFNGIDAVILATGNDFRATEAAGHAYAAKDGQYRSLSYCDVSDGVFRFWLDIPLAIGTVGGLTSLHPLAKKSLEILGNPDSRELMRIIAAVGLAQNFAAVRSLVTTGIQHGHMKMHLMNILNHLNATEQEMPLALEWFEDKIVSFAAVRDFLHRLREASTL